MTQTANTNQPIAFGLLAVGAMLLTSALTGNGLGDILKGHFGSVSTNPSNAGVGGVGAGMLSGSSYAGTYTGASSGSQKQVASELISYFQGQGLTKAGASGIVGNWMQESGLNSDEHGGYLGQWLGSRLTNLQKFASSSNQSVTDVGTQAEFAMQELQSYPSLLHLLKTTNDPSAAALAVSQQYERPGTPDNANREAYAQAAFNGTL